MTVLSSPKDTELGIRVDFYFDLQAARFFEIKSSDNYSCVVGDGLGVGPTCIILSFNAGIDSNPAASFVLCGVLRQAVEVKLL